MRLQDSRDGKYYWVAKMKDGNCWMTQNLDFDLTYGMTLTPEDSDVSSPWTPGNVTFNRLSNGQDNVTAIQAWDFGEWVKLSPTVNDYCFFSDDDRITANTCPEVLSQVTTNMEAWNEDVNGGRNAEQVVVTQGNNYDAHYLVGNYYSWPAATAGSGNSTGTSQEATDSICPKGWVLPMANTTANGSIRRLLESYGFPPSIRETTNGTSVSYPVSVDNYHAELSPLYFARTGYLYIQSGDYPSGGGIAGNGGFSMWTSISGSQSGTAYSFGTTSWGLGTGGLGQRDDGLSVRCLALGY